MIVIGLMSGTSADGVDAAVVRLDGAPPHLRWQILAHHHRPHPDDLRREIFAAFRPETGSPELLCRLNFALGEAFAAAALDALDGAGLTADQVDLIGSHGQTVWHIPSGPGASTLQLGEAAVIAERTGLPVVSNFRTRDMAAGGQGAPLVAAVDVLLLTHPHKVRVAQNIGGIANLTFLPPPGSGLEPLAFDTGPGNMLIDAVAGRVSHGSLTCDLDGRLAAAGRVDEVLLADLLADPYLHQPPPKTTGRERFGVQTARRIWDIGQSRSLRPEDLLATLTAFTARSIAAAYRGFLPVQPDEIILSGGGAHNPTLRRMLAEAAAPARLLTSDELSLGVEVKEALAFAVLAYETWHGRPTNLPAATGAARPVVLGSITPGVQRLDLAAFLPPPVLDPNSLQTEARNPLSADIDRLPTLQMLEIFNAEDRRIAPALATELEAIAAAVDAIADRVRSGGRLIYIGAGTSGRLGVLDASECPPTFNTDPSQVTALLAGGLQTMFDASEGAEDNQEAGRSDVAHLQIRPQDAVVGIAASGATPYVLAGLEEARQRGALTVGVACNRPAAMQSRVDIFIAPQTGPEILTGSTRLKAGTAQKLVLNMISSGVMIRIGKTYGNLMVDVRATNAKLRRRAMRIVAQATGLDEPTAANYLESCNGEVKTTIVAARLGLDPDAARARLAECNGVVRCALGE
jgi:anhydro-N-acetylmuramic acid kinase